MAKANDLGLMADESVCSAQDLERAVREGYFDMINVRLSKCGGFLNSMRMIQKSRSAGIKYQVGCQLGESGILSAAGRALCVLCSDALYYDGSYDEFLLKHNLTTDHVTFSLRGRALPLEGPGLGITVSQQNLKEFSEYSFAIRRHQNNKDPICQ